MPDGLASESLEALYRGLVVERARSPRHAGTMPAPDATGNGANPLCGDRVQVSLRRDPQGRLGEIRHGTEGCAICAASADLMAESVTGLHPDAAEGLWHRFEALLRQGKAGMVEADRQALGLLNAFADLHDYKARRKCATLPWSALLAALQADKET